MTALKPDHLQWVSPYLAVADVDQAIRFYSEAFGFEKMYTFLGPDGETRHGEMRYEDGVIMMGQAVDGRRTPRQSGASSVTMYIYTSDVEALCQRARAAGAEVLKQPEEQFWGDRTALVADPDGHTWMWSTHVRHVDPATIGAVT